MATTKFTVQILLSLNSDKSIRSIQCYDHLQSTDDATGVAYPDVALPPRDATEADANALLGASLLAGQAQIKDLTAQLATASNQATADAATIKELQDQLGTTASPAATDTLLASLNGVFATIPAEFQAQFANEYATVRVLIQAGQPALASAVVEGVAVPESLEGLKAQILSVLQG